MQAWSQSNQERQTLVPEEHCDVCNGDRTGEGDSGDVNLEPMEVKTASKQNRCHVQSLSLNQFSERQYILAIDVVLRNL